MQQTPGHSPLCSLPSQSCAKADWYEESSDRSWSVLATTLYFTLKVRASSSAPPASWIKKLKDKPAARASILTGLYITLVGLALAAAPCKVFGLLFDASTVARGWIQVGGILAVLYGIYYLGAGIGDCCEMGAQGFYMSTILGRLVLSLSFAWLAGAQAVPQGILILAAVNLVGAASMVRALLPRSAS